MDGIHRQRGSGRIPSLSRRDTNRDADNRLLFGHRAHQHHNLQLYRGGGGCGRQCFGPIGTDPRQYGTAHQQRSLSLGLLQQRIAQPHHRERQLPNRIHQLLCRRSPRRSDQKCCRNPSFECPRHLPCPARTSSHSSCKRALIELIECHD